MRDERLVLDLCGNGHVILMVVSGRPFANPIGQMTEVDRRRPTRMLRNFVQWKMSPSIMKRCPDPACDAELWIRDVQESSARQRGLSCLCENSPSIERRQSGM